jgi:hypothetical protein
LHEQFRSAQLEERYTRIVVLTDDHVISTASPLILDLALTQATDLRSDYMNGAEYVPFI